MYAAYTKLYVGYYVLCTYSTRCIEDAFLLKAVK